MCPCLRSHFLQPLVAKTLHLIASDFPGLRKVMHIKETSVYRLRRQTRTPYERTHWFHRIDALETALGKHRGMASCNEFRHIDGWDA